MEGQMMECFADQLELFETLRKFGVPEHTWGGWSRYLLDHVEPGRFLKAVICNDFVGALEAADDVNLVCLKSYAMFMYNALPHRGYDDTCWGSEKAVKQWLAQRHQTSPNAT